LSVVEPHEYETLFEFETSYWWYKGLHSILLDTLRELGVGPGSSVLDAGCGTGQNLVNTRERLSAGVYGFDVAPEAAPFWRRRGLDPVCLGSTNDIPFASARFDAVISVDVLECDAVREEQALRELWRVLKPGGHLVLVVPAYDWLMTEEHHRAVGASRRYSQKKVRSLLERLHFDLSRVTHVFALLLPPIAIYRLGLRHLKKEAQGPPKSELRALNPTVNELLFRIVEVERRMLRRWDLPFGSSILAVARKVG